MFRIITLIFFFSILHTISLGQAKVIKVEYYSDGNIKMEMTKMKRGIVKITQYYPSGDLFEVGYSKHGKYQGQWTRFDEKGELVATAFYQNHIKIGSWNHYNQWDQSTSKVSYSNGQAVAYSKYNHAGELIAYETR